MKTRKASILVIDEATAQVYDWWKLSIQFSAASFWDARIGEDLTIPPRFVGTALSKASQV